MTELTILIAAAITNAITKLIKPSKEGLTDTQKVQRKKILRIFTASVSVISVVFTAWAMREPVDMVTLGDALQTLIMGATTWIASQGTYFLAKGFRKE